MTTTPAPTDTSREAIERLARRGLLILLYTSGGEQSDLPEEMGAALIALLAEKEAVERERDAAIAALRTAGEALEKTRVFVNAEFLRRAAGDDESYDEDEQAIPLLHVIDAALAEIRKALEGKP
jgi:hypothetical protein